MDPPTLSRSPGFIGAISISCGQCSCRSDMLVKQGGRRWKMLDFALSIVNLVYSKYWILSRLPFNHSDDVWYAIKVPCPSRYPIPHMWQPSSSDRPLHPSRTEWQHLRMDRMPWCIPKVDLQTLLQSISHPTPQMMWWRRSAWLCRDC